MNKMRNLISVLLGLVVGLTLLAACQSQEADLPFETIERSEWGEGKEQYSIPDPKLVIIAKAEEINAIGNTVSLDAQAQLRNLDFDQYFAAAVFQGWQPQLPPPPSGVEVQRISREGSIMTIYAHFHEPAGEVWRPVEVSPYHLVKVQKGEDMQGKLEFVLNIDGTDVVRQAHLIP